MSPESEETLIQDAFTQPDYAICITDPKGNLLRVNEAYRKLYKFGPDESIASEAMPHRFEPFFTTKGAAGSGLGLSLSRHILAAHGGEIHCESSGGSTVFRIQVPTAAENRKKFPVFTAEIPAQGQRRSGRTWNRGKIGKGNFRASRRGDR
jgi:hypothetical protein